jgi:hypothetical protein
MSEKPEEPDFNALEDQMRMSPMDQDAVQMHELFQSLIRAGFREKAALYLVAMIVNESMEQQDSTFIRFDPDFEEDDDSDNGTEV